MNVLLRCLGRFLFGGGGGGGATTAGVNGGIIVRLHYLGESEMEHHDRMGAGEVGAS